MSSKTAAIEGLGELRAVLARLPLRPNLLAIDAAIALIEDLTGDVETCTETFEIQAKSVADFRQINNDLSTAIAEQAADIAWLWDFLDTHQQQFAHAERPHLPPTPTEPPPAPTSDPARPAKPTPCTKPR